MLGITYIAWTRRSAFGMRMPLLFALFAPKLTVAVSVLVGYALALPAGEISLRGCTHNVHVPLLWGGAPLMVKDMHKTRVHSSRQMAQTVPS